MAVLSKVLTKTDVQKRLSVRTVNKKCFLDFGNKHKVEFKVEDKNGDVWPFVCSTRKGQDYPKPVLSKGWLRFVRRWKLAIGDRVVLHEIQGKAGTGLYRIEVIKRAKQSPGVLSPSILNHDGDRSMGNIGKEPTGTTHSTDQAMAYNQTDGPRDQTVSTVTSHSTDQAMAYKQTEGLRDQPVSAVTFHSTDQAMAYNQTERLNDLPVTDRVGSTMVEFICLKPRVQVKEPKFIDFFELESQDRKGKDMVESPSTSLTTRFFEFL
ncbi:Uncharacterized protein TCM_006242 [Theobroma cacao]|uniref:TF-B3 domain-containing protein n=1 Tax=Theobroma cacao TaxID=3641 RepID=A0A061E4G0_THECC|nr:Uncharacterized protein TCM_006242 [Theobroma cacao]